MTVYATDGGLPPNFAKVIVRIRVLDENDNVPAFGRLYYSLEVPENIKPVALFTMRATDQDSGDSGKLQYKITGQTPQTATLYSIISQHGSTTENNSFKNELYLERYTPNTDG